MASNDEQRSATTIFTTAAQSIAARLIANKTTAKFTKAEISTTNLFNQSVTELQVLTSLDNVQQTADINTVTVINDSTVDVNIAIDQTKAPNDYQMNSVGLFAVDGDGKEVLYSVTVLKDPVYIHQDAMGSALGIDLETVVGQSSNVDLSINPAGAVTNEALKVTLADYVKTDDVKSLIPATVIDGSKPADFKESVTLEKGAVDGEGNAIATTKDVSDGDAETLKSAKEYADTKVSGKANDSTVVHTADMRKPASDVAGIEEVNAKQDKLTITPADDSKVAHLSGANNFDTTPTVNNNPLLLASSLPSDLARTGQDANFTAKLQQNGQDVALANNTIARNPNTGVVSTPTDFTKLTVNGGKSVATRDDLKSLEASAWKLLVNSDATTAFYRLVDGTLYISGYARVGGNYGKTDANLTIVKQLPTELQNKAWTIKNDMTVGLNDTNGSTTADLKIGKSSLIATSSVPDSWTTNGIVIFNNSYTQS
ncbi:hypothetical protein [Levilactobacillus wangkuiensis]|uniref:hypothetical protein n=1 Tax=Levilactobacillus wangkuiensis TaxID=2799566 RepID=UPI0019444DBD|nr:hypothetical protein [Levilactobacillus wangkuiensis]